MTPQEGRKALDETLCDEIADAKDEFARALYKAKAGVEEAFARLDAGQALTSSATGNVYVVPDNVNALGTLYMAAQKRRARLLALYDRVNGTSADADA